MWINLAEISNSEHLKPIVILHFFLMKKWTRKSYSEDEIFILKIL